MKKWSAFFKCHRAAALILLFCLWMQGIQSAVLASEVPAAAGDIAEIAVGIISDNAPQADIQGVAQPDGTDATHLSVPDSDLQEAQDGMQVDGASQEDSLAAEMTQHEYNTGVSGNTVGEPLHILFVGNSFTNNEKKNKVGYSLTTQLAQMAAQTGKNVQITSLAYGGAKLKFYAGERGKRREYYTQLRKLLWERTWDYIVLQDNSRSSAFGLEEDMLPALASLNTMIRTLQPDAKLLLYMTHGYACRDDYGAALSIEEMQRTAAAGCYRASVEEEIELVPAGMHFRRLQLLYPDLQLYLRDGKHPNPNGYYVLAASFYYRFFGEVPIVDVTRQTGVTMTQQQAQAASLLVQDGITMDKHSMTLRIGERERVQAGGNGADAGVSYTTLDGGVVEIDRQKGILTAVANGKSVIIAQTPDGCQAFCLVDVPDDLRFDKTTYWAEVGDRFEIRPEGYTKKMRWSSSNEAVATVDRNGWITAKSTGITYITVTGSKGREAGFNLYVSCGRVRDLVTDTARTQPLSDKEAAIKLSWSRSSGAESYAVYRADRKNGRYRWIGNTYKTKYIDRTAKTNQKYFYKVQPLSRKGSWCDGKLSEPAAGKVLTVRRVRLKKEAAGIRLIWKKNAGAKGYVVYRAAKKDGKYRVVATLKGRSSNRYTDLARKKGKIYYYKVVPYWGKKGDRRYGRPSDCISG